MREFDNGDLNYATGIAVWFILGMCYAGRHHLSPTV